MSIESTIQHVEDKIVFHKDKSHLDATDHLPSRALRSNAGLPDSYLVDKRQSSFALKSGLVWLGLALFTIGTHGGIL